MKICPKCQTKYEEEIIRFCTKDGSPLTEENPIFTAMPSQSFSETEIEEETVIMRNRPQIPAAPENYAGREEKKQKVVIPIAEEKKQSVKPLEKSPTHSTPRKSNTPLVVALTMIGTTGVLALGGLGWWLFNRSPEPTANKNVAVIVSNANAGVNYNVATDFGSNSNIDFNANANATPSPTKTPSPSPTKTPTPKPTPAANANANVSANANSSGNAPVSNSNVGGNNVIIIGSPTPTPTKPPTPPPTNVNIGNLNSRAKELRKPAYPPVAKQMGASGQVVVQVSIDEGGNVTGAKAVSGHALLRTAAEAAARQSSFIPVKVGDRPVKAVGTITYNFINQ